MYCGVKFSALRTFSPANVPPHLRQRDDLFHIVGRFLVQATMRLALDWIAQGKYMERCLVRIGSINRGRGRHALKNGRGVPHPIVPLAYTFLTAAACFSMQKTL